MKRLRDYDEHQQALPKNKKMSDLETGQVHIVGVKYAKLSHLNSTKAELLALIADLEEDNYLNNLRWRAVLKILVEEFDADDYGLEEMRQEDLEDFVE
jgi:hypothetical protein